MGRLGMSATHSTAVARLDLKVEQDVVHARRRARLIAEVLGFNLQDQTRISTAVSEIARNAQHYGGGGVVKFSIAGPSGSERLEIIVRDQGPGIRQIDEILEGRYTSHTGMGLGIPGSRKLLSPHFHIETQPGQGTTVTMGKELPKSATPVSPALFARLSEALAKARSDSPLEEIHTQNHELIMALQLLHESEANFRNLMEASVDGIVVVTVDGRISLANRGAARMLRRSKEELLGTHFGSPVVAGETAEMELLSPLGESLCAEIRVSDTEWAGERASLVSLRDVTEHKRAALQLRLGSEELQRLNRSLHDRNSEIQNFYHTLSHELKTPLTAAREFISILIDGLAGPLNDTQLEYLAIAMESCDQLRLYVNDLLDVTRLETGKMKMQQESLSVAALAERVVEILGPAAATKGIDLSCDCALDLPAVPADRQRILQVLSNLTTNAIKFTPAGGTIRISVAHAPAHAGGVQVSVRDSGVGIPREHLDQIFDRLYQVAEAGAVGEPRGLGLGLYICQELIALHGGRIWAESVAGEGSTFTFTLPESPAAVGSVLVVDDDPVLAGMLCDLLEDAGYRVSVAGGGAEALDLMRHELPALVILDLKMAGMDGPEAMREIRRRGPRIPVIVHTGFPESDLMTRMLEFSPFTVVAKPALPGEMLESVRALWQERGPTGGRQEAP